MAATGRPLENHLDKSLAVRWRFHRWPTGGPPEACYQGSALIRLNKDSFEGHLCQTVHNFVKQNKSSLLSPLRKRRPPQFIKHIKNTTVSCIPNFDEPCSSTLHPLNTITVVLFLWVPNSGAILYKSANKKM